MAKTFLGQWRNFVSNLLGWIGLDDNYESAIGADSKARTKQMLKIADQFKDFLDKYRVKHDQAVKLYNELQAHLPASMSIPASVLSERRRARKQAANDMEKASQNYDKAQQLATTAQSEFDTRIKNDKAGTFKENSKKNKNNAIGPVSNYDQEAYDMVKKFEKELK